MDAFKNPINAIKSWSSELKEAWLKELAEKILATKRELSDQELDRVYSLFLKEKQLLDNSENIQALEYENREKLFKKEKNPSEKEPSSMNIAHEDKADDSIKKLQINQVFEVNGVNAILPGQKLKFHPNLTVIYGHNASGKTGYVRILKRASSSRTAEDIWDNIHKNKEKNNCSAKFLLNINNKKTQEIGWNGETDLSPLTLMDVFDNKCVKVFLTEKLDFSFKPYGFELFSFISSAITWIKNKLSLKIRLEKQTKDFTPYFKEDTSIFNLIKNINMNTNIEDINALAKLNKSDLERFEKTKKEKEDLEVIEYKLEATENDLREAGRLKSLYGMAMNDIDVGRIEEYKKSIKSFIQAKKSFKEKAKMQLNEYNIPSLESTEWEDFIESAEIYINILPNSDSYPEHTDKCIYCKQDLSKLAIQLILTYRKIISAHEVIKLEETREKIKESITKLKEKKFSLKEENFKSIKKRLEPQNSELYNEIKINLHNAEVNRQQIIDNLSGLEWNELKSSFDKRLEVRILEVIDTLKKEKEKLATDNKKREEKIILLTKEINELWDRQELVKRKEEIINYLNNIKWVNKAEKILSDISTRSVTLLSKKVWESIVTDEFKAKFDEERANFDAPKIDFDFPGEHGETKRGKSIEGFANIDDFLSEGEQNAIALADFLAEVSLSKNSFPIIFDDPVSSFDHIRRRKIAKRLVEESSKRQVIIFTHDILFLSYLNELCESKDDSYFFHWVERCDEGLYGKICLNDCPILDSYNAKIKKVKESIEKAKQLSGSEREKEIMMGFSFLRAAYENYVIEKIFKKVILRFEERVQMLNLNKIKFNPEALKEIRSKFIELSRFIEAHSHSDTGRYVQPSVEYLEKELEFINNYKYS